MHVVQLAALPIHLVTQWTCEVISLDSKVVRKFLDWKEFQWEN